MILFTILEPEPPQDNLLPHHTGKINYEEESIRCFKSWRNAEYNQLKDIRIICINPSKQDVNNKTKEEFKSLNIEYRHNHIKCLDKHKCRWHAIPYIGMKLEEELPPEVDILHIDLDMIIISNIRDDMLSFNNTDCIVGAYDTNQPIRHYNEYSEWFNTNLSVTCYILSKANKKIYKKWYIILEHLLKFEYKEWDAYCNLEEYAFDLLRYDISIKYIKEFCIGYGYTDIIKHPDKIDNIVFIHTHNENERFKLYKEYLAGVKNGR